MTIYFSLPGLLKYDDLPIVLPPFSTYVIRRWSWVRTQTIHITFLFEAGRINGTYGKQQLCVSALEELPSEILPEDWSGGGSHLEPLLFTFTNLPDTPLTLPNAPTN